MSFIDLPGLGDTKETEVQPDGRYPLRVGNIKSTNSKKGRPMLQVVVDFDGVENATPIFHYVTFPMEGDEANTIEMMMLNIARFLFLTGIPHETNGFNPEDLLGASFEADVVKEDISEEGQEPRFSNSLVLPRLPADPAVSKSRGRKRA